MKKNISVALLLIISAVAHADPITSLTITGGSAYIQVGPPKPLTLGAHSDMTIGGYDGGPRVSADILETAIVANVFIIPPTEGFAFTAPNDDFNSGFPPPTGDITNGIATLDLSSWTLWWNGGILNQGTNSLCNVADFVITFETTCSSGPAVITYDAATGVFTADWSSVIISGTWQGNVGYWHLEGIILAEPPCPLPADSGDLNGDCKLDSADVLLLQRKVSGLQ